MIATTSAPAGEAFRTFGFAILRRFFDAAALGAEIDHVLRTGIRSQQPAHYDGIRFQYVPMMTAETPISVNLLDRAGALAATVLGGPVIPTRAKGTRYFGNSPWHTDSELPITSIGFLAYCEPLDAENGALRVIPGSHHLDFGNAIRKLRVTAEAALFEFSAHVAETQPGDLIMMDEHLFHASHGGTVRRQWRADYLRVPADAEEEANTKAYFAGIYAPGWDGGYDVDRYPSYGTEYRDSGRPAAEHLKRLGVFDLADRHEAFSRPPKQNGVDR